MTRTVCRVALAFFITTMGLQWPAVGQSDYPNQPIRLIVPYAPGGVPDTSARLLAQKLQVRIGQSVVVENRPSGNGGVAAAVINASAADGYTLLVVDTTLLSVSPIFINDLSYDPKKDFVPIAALARTPLFLAVNAQMPIKTLEEFVAYVRAHPGQLNYGSAGVGSTHQLTMEAMKAALHLDIVHVPFRGSGEAVPALLGNHVQALWAAYPSLKGGVERGEIRLLANNGLGHSPLLPELPPLADLIPGFDMVTVIGIYGRVGTPKSIVHKIADDSSTVMKDSEIDSQLAVLGMEPVGEGPEAFAKMIAHEVDTIAKVVEKAGLKAR
jgi:tripartite-type tricarboxylate transporter receptor subunit TctC